MMEVPRPTLPFTLRRLTVADAASYRLLRLEGLERHPEAFSASWEDEVSRPLTWFADRLDQGVVFGGFQDGPTLSGIVGFLVPVAPKTRHKGVLWGMFVQSGARGMGMAAALVGNVIEHARQVVTEVRLTVVTTNTAAIRLYTRVGFREYGLERKSLKVGDCYYDDLLMALSLTKRV